MLKSPNMHRIALQLAQTHNVIKQSKVKGKVVYINGQPLVGASVLPESWKLLTDLCFLGGTFSRNAMGPTATGNSAKVAAGRMMALPIIYSVPSLCGASVSIRWQMLTSS